MDEASRSAWCREKGVYPQELESWRVSATQASPRVRLVVP
jgi:hypothetical protein